MDELQNKEVEEDDYLDDDVDDVEEVTEIDEGCMDLNIGRYVMVFCPPIPLHSAMSFLPKMCIRIRLSANSCYASLCT